MSNVNNTLDRTSKTNSDTNPTNNIILQKQNYVNNDDNVPKNTNLAPVHKTMNPTEITNMRIEEVSAMSNLSSKNLENYVICKIYNTA